MTPETAAGVDIAESETVYDIVQGVGAAAGRLQVVVLFFADSCLGQFHLRSRKHWRLLDLPPP